MMDLKEPHRLVFQALSAANIAHGRAVSVSEILEAITDRERAQLASHYEPTSFSHMVGKILDLLRARGFVFSPGKVGRARYYAAVGEIDPEKAELPSEGSRRQRVLRAVREAVAHQGRAVLQGEVVGFEQERPDPLGISAEEFRMDIPSLVATGELVVVAEIRGDTRGGKLYLPSDLDPSRYMPEGPLTWLEEVATVIQDLWRERLRNTTAESLPTPLSTGEVRAHLAERSPDHESLRNPQVLVNAMQELARTARPVIRKVVRKGERANLWAPAGVTDDQLDLAASHATDTDRIVEAVRRTQRRLGRPVTVIDVEEELSQDPALIPQGRSPVHRILADLAKETLASGRGPRVSRRSQSVILIGRAGGRSFYASEQSNLAQGHVQTQALLSRIADLNPDARLDGLEICSIPTVGIGRARLLSAELTRLHSATVQLEQGELYAADRESLVAVRQDLARQLGSVHAWLAEAPDVNAQIPDDVDEALDTSTAEELLELYAPLHPRSRTLDDPAEMIRLFYKRIRRVPNPDHTRRFDSDAHEAAEYLFDRTDALIYAAHQWGGYECRLQAGMAAAALDRLRDVRFVIPGLFHRSYEVRLASVACLAFLGGPAALDALHNAAVGDEDPGVRDAATWAYGFAGGADARSFVEARTRNGEAEFSELLDLDDPGQAELGWWKL